MATMKKAQNGAKTADSTSYFKKKAQEAYGAAAMNMTRNPESMFKLAKEYGDAGARQAKKGKPGYDKNGFPLKKKKMKNGGSLSALKASTKRDKGIDPKGAYTTVQKKTLAGAKGKAKLTADKQLGATKMTAKRGMKISKKK